MLPKERIPGPALAVGGRVQQVAVDFVVLVRIAPPSRVRADEMPEPGWAVVCPLVDRVKRCDVPAHEKFRGRLPVAEHVVGHAEPRLQVLLIERAVLGWEHHRVRQEDVWPHLLLREVIAEVLEA